MQRTRQTGHQALLVLVFLTVMLMGRTATAQVTYRLLDLGTLPGFQNSAARSINAYGQVVGFSWSGDMSPSGIGVNVHPFLYTDSSLIDLGTLGGSLGYANGINDLGQISGWSTLADDTTQRAFLDMGGVMTDLGSLGGAGSVAYGLNNAGQIVGEAETDSGDWHTFVWSDGIMQDLGTVPGYPDSSSYSINAAGQIAGIGATYPETPPWTAVVWDSSSVTALSGLGGSNSVGLYINAFGQVAGQAQTTDGSGHAVVWTPTTPNGAAFNITDFGTLSGDTDSIALAVNFVGQVVGASGTADDVAAFVPGGRAFIADTVTSPQDLNQMIPAGSGWTLECATAINDYGQIIGWGLTPQGDTHAFLLTPDTQVELAAVTLRSTKVTGSLSTIGTVLLSAPTAVPLVISLRTSNAAAKAPVHITIPAGAIRAAFPITTRAVRAVTPGAITATYRHITLNKDLTVVPIGVRSLSLTPATVSGPSVVKGVITLKAPAAPGDITVMLVSSNPSAVSLPASSVIVPKGNTQAAFLINAGQVTTITPVVISATSNNVTVKRTLTVKP